MRWSRGAADNAGQAPATTDSTESANRSIAARWAARVSPGRDTATQSTPTAASSSIDATTRASSTGRVPHRQPLGDEAHGQGFGPADGLGMAAA